MSTIRQRLRDLAREQPVRLDVLTTVRRIEPLTPSYTRLTIGSSDLRHYDPVMPADGVKLVLSVDGRDLVRSYTTSTYNHDAGELTVDVLTHGAGIVATWLARVRPGQQVRLLAARRDFALGTDIAHHLLIADACALPAATAIIEHLPENTSATAFLHAPTDADQSIVKPRYEDEIHWITGPPPLAADNPFLHHLTQWHRPSGPIQIWIAAEAGAVAQLRRSILASDLTDRDNLHAVAYWKVGTTSDERDHRIHDHATQAISNGLDINDPQIRTHIEQTADGTAPTVLDI